MIGRRKNATHRLGSNLLRTTIDIDDDLMKRAMRASGLKTKRATVQHGLELMVRFADQETLIRSTRGKLHWEGDLKAMRRDRFKSSIIVPKRGK